MKLIKNAAVYSPEYLGKKDVLVAGRQICNDSRRDPASAGTGSGDDRRNWQDPDPWWIDSMSMCWAAEEKEALPTGCPKLP